MRPAAAVGLTAGALIGAALASWVAGRLDVVEVRGRSMEPSLRPGDRLLIVRAQPRVGDVVLAADPRAPDRELIKRVSRIDAGGVWLSGDNPGASTDARTFGAVSPARVRWRAVMRYWPLEPPALLRRVRRPAPAPARSRPEASPTPTS